MGKPGKLRIRQQLNEVLGKRCGVACGLAEGLPDRLIEDTSPRHRGIAQVEQDRKESALVGEALQVAVGPHPALSPGVIEG